MQALSGEARFLLLWSPGATDHPQHPGDDAKAQTIMRAAGRLPLGGLSDPGTERSGGGTVACGLRNLQRWRRHAHRRRAGQAHPVFFGDSEPTRWHPWGVPYRLLQPASRDASEISVAAALRAFRELELA